MNVHTLRRVVAASGLLVWTGVVAACAGAPAPSRQTIEFSGPTMGATFTVKVVTGPEGLAGAPEIDALIRADLERINVLMSTWDPASELSRFNQSPSLDPFPVAPETFEVFAWARTLEAMTGGALDVTVGPLLDAWGFGPAGPRDLAPTDAEVARLLEGTGLRHVVLDAEARTVRKLRPDIVCEFSSLAPGYAADRLAALLVERGATDFLVDVGGEFRVRGFNDAGTPWQIAVERPTEQGRFIERMIPITDGAIATSGDYRNYHEVEGVRVAHILDPRTGRPIRHRLASVTVVDALGVRADGLSTALMVLGPDEGYALAESLDLAALFIVRAEGGDGFESRGTPRFEALAAPAGRP
ncbi:MAG: FAD:protein FMN transferase [Vicinamibacterales bacterium]|nr:FAD:protein FMN transferase [Vicinamibacterales bacterium]